jgi:hypothetical protein
LKQNVPILVQMENPKRFAHTATKIQAVLQRAIMMARAKVLDATTNAMVGHGKDPIKHRLNLLLLIM